jgi:adenosine deaminase
LTLAWELSIRDLKKLSINGIKYSSISEDKKDKLMKDVFPKKWQEFITYLNKL